MACPQPASMYPEEPSTGPSQWAKHSPRLRARLAGGSSLEQKHREVFAVHREVFAVGAVQAGKR